MVLILCLLTVSVFLYQNSFAGEKEEIEYQIAYWQEHLKALQMDFELSQNKLREAVTKKQAFDKKMKDESDKSKNN